MRVLLRLGIQPSFVIKPPAPSSKDHDGGSDHSLSGPQIAFALAVKDQKLPLTPRFCQVSPHPGEGEHRCSEPTQSRFPGNNQIHFSII